jgi:hypothetical protein
MLSWLASNRISVKSLGMAALLVIWLIGCASTGPPPPQTGYRADVNVMLTDASTEGPKLVRLVEFYYMGKRRRETRVDGDVVALIDRPDLRISWVLSPKANSFEEHQISNLEAEITLAPNPFGPRAKASYELLGTENVDGVDTRKYAVTGKAISGYAWFTIDQIPLRFNGTIGSEDSSVELEVAYTEIRRGSQAAYRFAVPPTYAGYDKRKVKRSRAPNNEIDDAARRLREQQIGRGGPDPRGLALPAGAY